MSQKKVSPTPKIAQTTVNQARVARQQRRNTTTIVFGLIAVVAVIVVATIAILNLQSGQPDEAAKILSTITATNSNGDIVGVQTFTGLTRNHTAAPVTYAQVPPVGGDHSPAWLNCGIYTQTVHNENAVHSMEHGAVWITYQPNLADNSVSQLQNLVRGHGYVLLSPYPSLPSPVVASAWGLQLKVNSAYDPRLALFIQKYENGPQTPEPGAPCSGGLGSPIS